MLHLLLGALTAVVGAALLLVAVLLAGSGAYEAVRLALFYLSELRFDELWYPKDVLLNALLYATLIGLPALALLVSGAVGLLGGFGVLRRRPLGRVVAMLWAGCAMVLGPFGVLLGVITLVVLLDPASRREFGAAAVPAPVPEGAGRSVRQGQ